MFEGEANMQDPKIALPRSELMLASRVRPNAPTRRQLIKVVAVGVAAPAVLRIAGALAAYPERPVRIVVANTPGGPSDIIARIMAATLQEATGGTFFVENRGGGGGNIGMGVVARSEPDGYTILLATSAYAVNPSLFETLPYDPFKDFVAIAELATSPNVFAVKPELGAATINEFVARAKQEPDKFNVSTPPIGTIPHVQAELLKVREGLGRMATVTHTGGGEALRALLSNTVQLSSGALPPAHPHIKSGAIKGLAVTGAARWHDLPDIPTMLEAGYKDFVFETYTSLMAPARTPPETVTWLENESLKVLQRPDLRSKLVEAGFEVQAKPGRTHMARVAREVPMYREIIASAGIARRQGGG
jgi:tripartite-type tricarboxylate transporter receptor subunit TctC